MIKKKEEVSGEIEFVFNGKRSISAILYIIQQSDGEINHYNLLKIIFEADKYHLNKYGRPVTGDLYRNMDFGTVPVAIYNTVKGNRSPKKYLKEMGMTGIPYNYNRSNYMLSSSVAPNHRFLTKTSIEALDRGIKKYRDLSFEKVKEENHKEKCWRETKKNQFIPFELIIEDKEILEQLSEHPYGIVV